MRNFKLYTTPTCPYCIRAKSLLNSKGFKYEEVVVGQNGVTRDDVAKVLPPEKRVDRITVPQIFEGEKHIGGYTDLVSYLS